MNDIKTIGIVGRGQIGASLATLFSGNGYEVILLGSHDTGVNKGEIEISHNFDELISEGIMDEKQKAVCMSKVRYTYSYEDLSGIDFCYEAVTEDVEIKRDVYQKVEQCCQEDIVIASATSAISADVLGNLLVHKERFLVAHPWNPAHVVPLVEVCKSQHTDEAAVKITEDLLNNVGKKVVTLNKNIEGFIGNRLQHALFREAMYLIDEGIATPEQIDDVVYYSFGQRYSSIGIFEHYDAAGLPLQKEVQSNLFPTLCNTDQPQKCLISHIEAGELGARTKRGVLDWSKIDEEDFRKRQRKPFYRFIQWNFPEE